MSADRMKQPMDPTSVAEDDDLRSRYMRELIQSPSAPGSPAGHTKIPRVVVQFWHDSEAIPPDVADCLHSWEALTTQGFQRIMFDDTGARRFIAEHFSARHLQAFDLCRHPAMRCDYFRLCYIGRCGGFYVDADEVYQGADCEVLFRDTDLKLQPLCYDSLSDTMIPPEIFLRDEASAVDWIFYVNNNPLIAPPSHPVVCSALSRSTGLLLSRPEKRTDIQATTGPGNLTATLVKHSMELAFLDRAPDFVLLDTWSKISVSRWPLSYRQDSRNWRLWHPSD